MFIAVAMGGPSPEHDVSLESGASVVQALLARGHRVESLIIGPDGAFRFAGKTKSPIETTRRMLAAGVDAVFLALHGFGGEDGHIQAWFEWTGLPYTGAGLASSALAINKSTFKAVLVDCGLPTPLHINIHKNDWRSDPELMVAQAMAGPGLPAMLKVSSGGSSHGVVLVRDQEQARLEAARLFSQDAMIVWEALAIGDEFSVPTYKLPDGELAALPVIKIIPQKGDYFDLASKYEEGGAEEIVPAPISAELASQMKELAIRCHGLIGARGLARTDFIVGPDGPVILEINSIPGLTPASLAPKAMQAAGIDMGALCEELLKDALNRPLIYQVPPHACDS